MKSKTPLFRVTAKEDDDPWKQAIQSLQVGDKLKLRIHNRTFHVTVSLIEVADV